MKKRDKAKTVLYDLIKQDPNPTARLNYASRIISHMNYLLNVISGCTTYDIYQYISGLIFKDVVKGVKQSMLTDEQQGYLLNVLKASRSKKLKEEKEWFDEKFSDSE